MKKTLSIVLSIVMLFSIISTVNLSAYANDTNFYNYDLAFGVTQSGNASYINKVMSVPCYKFSLSTYTSLCLDYDSTVGGEMIQGITIIKYSDYSDYKIGKEVPRYYNKETNTVNDINHWLDDTISLYKGTYCMLITNWSILDVSSSYSFSLTPTVNKLKNLKATASSESVKLSWTGDLGSQGYQIQKKTSNGYKTIKETTNTSFTIKNLSPATQYSFRVRGYVNVGGKKYYGVWKNTTLATSPAKVSIKAPSTNKKHQIIAKWNKVTRASGYQVQYCKNKSCSNVIATKTVSGGSKTSYTGKNFTKGKKYYVRVRAYKTVNGTKYYGAWSGVKSITCK